MAKARRVSGAHCCCCERDLDRTFPGWVRISGLTFSMQLYEGLDIITNKVTEEEQHQCRHHLLSYLHPFSSTSNTVVQFRDKALPIIEKLVDEGKLPIIVGGTNYYIESLLWRFLIDKKDGEEPPPTKKVRVSASAAGASVTHEGEGHCYSTELTYSTKETSDVDASCTKTVAEKDGKLKRQDTEQLDICDSDSKCQAVSTTDACSSNPDSASDSHSDVEAEVISDQITECRDMKQQADRGQKDKVAEGRKQRADRGGKFNDIDSSELHKRLMLVDPESAKRLHPHNRRKIIRALEVYEDHGCPMSEILKAQHSPVGDSAVSGPLRYQHTCIFWIQCDKTVLDERLDGRVDGMMRQGLLQELHDFHRQYRQVVEEKQRSCDYTLGMFQSIGFKEFHSYLLLPEDGRDTVQGKQLMNDGLDALKLATRQYARRQIKWIKNRFLKRPGPGVPPVYGVNSTDVSRWMEDVFNPACDILATIIKGETPSMAPLSIEGEVTKFVHNICDVCGGRVFTTQLEWHSHLNGRKHKRAFSKRRKQESLQPCDNSSSSTGGGSCQEHIAKES